MISAEAYDEYVEWMALLAFLDEDQLDLFL